MKSLISGLCVAFSMYSSIPMPQTEWNKSTMRWTLCFFPLVGAVVAGGEYLWFALCQILGISAFLYAAGAVLLTLALTGGIHLDGLTDVSDAIGSHGSKEQRLEIMKDPHVGAFGTMGQTAFLLTETALFYQLYLNPDFLAVALLGFVLARALGGHAIVSYPCAKNTGLAHLFAENSEKKTAKWILRAETALCILLFVPLAPTGVFCALMLLLALWSGLHHRICMKSFGGITGDLAGFLISITELLALAAAAVGGLIL